MASYFNRPSYTPSWNQRIFPVQEPSFAPPASPSSPPSSPRDTRPRSLRIVEPASPLHSPAREAPPPIYYPGPRRRSETSAADPLTPGLAPSTNTASSALCTVQWAYHPCAPDAQGGNGRWGRRLRLPEIWRALKGEKEVLWDGWPRQFGGRERVGWEAEQREDARAAAAAVADDEEGGTAAHRRARSLSLSLSRRSTRTTTGDSGIALTPHSTHEYAHPLAPLYKKRVAEVNALVNESLVTTRIWLALVELVDYVWVLALIVALAQGGGKQTGFLKGVEIGLVLVILLNGLGVNAVRMRRYTLARALRARTRDWSPLALTSSTNAQLMRNYLDGDADRGRTDSMAPKDGPVMRWRMRETEGSFWLGYRPIVRVELVTPSSFSAYALAYLSVIDPELGAPPEVVVATDEPPRYEDAH
ncbi:hypothetical protein JCM3770_003595 [Rhodotorula araucariae]